MATAHPILDKEHGDITYLKQDEIGLVLSKALAETYKAQPNDPVDFFAKFLLNHTRTAKKARDVRIIIHNGNNTGEGGREAS
jgi:Dpy-30 motif